MKKKITLFVGIIALIAIFFNTSLALDTDNVFSKSFSLVELTLANAQSGENTNCTYNSMQYYRNTDYETSACNSCRLRQSIRGYYSFDANCPHYEIIIWQYVRCCGL